jgi:hypothetical protein
LPALLVIYCIDLVTVCVLYLRGRGRKRNLGQDDRVIDNQYHSAIPKSANLNGMLPQCTALGNPWAAPRQSARMTLDIWM